MKTKLATIGLGLFAITALPVTLYWMPNPPRQQVTSYVLYSAPLQVTGPYQVIGTVTNDPANTNQLTYVYPVALGTEIYFFARASNLWGLSATSNVVSTPPAADGVTNIGIRNP
jgi:hypothetical protein